MSEDGLPPLREVIERHGLAAKKSLGQNFLFDLNLTRRIARSAGKLSDVTVVEVGPGPGGLTRALLMEGARKVVAIERDARALPALAEIAAHYPGRLEVIEGAALDPSWRTRVEGPARIVANLPYNIATPLLTGWLTTDPWPPWWLSLTLMFQKEVAERITARPGADAFGRLAVLSQWRSRAVKLFDIDRRAFSPPPNVTSSVVHIEPMAPLAELEVKQLERVTAAAFGQRRKMLRQSLKSLGVPSEALLEAAAIPPTKRAEELSIADFCRLTQAFVALNRP